MKTVVLSTAYTLESPGKLPPRDADFISLGWILGIIFEGSPGDPKAQLEVGKLNYTLFLKCGSWTGTGCLVWHCRLWAVKGKSDQVWNVLNIVPRKLAP